MPSNANGPKDLQGPNVGLKLVHRRAPLNRPLWIGGILVFAACAVVVLWMRDPDLSDVFFQGSTFVATSALALVTGILVSRHAAGATSIAIFDPRAQQVHIQYTGWTGPSLPRTIAFDQVLNLCTIRQTHGMMHVETLLLFPKQGKPAFLAEVQRDSRILRDGPQPGLADVANLIAARTSLPTQTLGQA